MAPYRNLGNKILELRASGLNYNEIVKSLNCSKSTVAHHCNATSRKKAYARKKSAHQNHTKLLKEERGGACEICGFNTSLRALQFHHINPAEKSFKISEYRGAAIETLRVEADKCALVCGNCHVMIHQKIIPCPPKRK